jgi:hypothetical protein
MAFNTIPISLEEENKRRVKLKKESKEFVASLNEIIDDPEEKEQEIGPITFEDELNKVLKPYIESGKYKESELEIIKKSLSNDILEGTKKLSEKKSVKTIPYIGTKKNINNGVNWIKKNILKKPDDKYIEVKPDYVNRNSLFSSVVPSNSIVNNSYYEPSLLETIGPQEYKKALENRKQIEIEKDDSLEYLRVYDDAAYGWSAGDGNFKAGREYVEIDGIRRTTNIGGDFTYEVYNIEDALAEENYIDVSAELEKATIDQIELFEDKLFEYEWENIVDQNLNDLNLTAGGDEQVQAEVSTSVAEDTDPEEDGKPIDIDDIDPEVIKKLLAIAFEEELGTGSDKERFIQEEEINETLKKLLETEGITFQIYESGPEADLIAVFKGTNKLGTFKPYGDPLSEEFYNIEDHLTIRSLNMAYDITEVQKNFAKEYNKKWEPIWREFFHGKWNDDEEQIEEGFNNEVFAELPEVIQSLTMGEITYEEGKHKGQTVEYWQLFPFVEVSRRYKGKETWKIDGKTYRSMDSRELRDYINDINEYFEEMNLPRPNYSTILTDDDFRVIKIKKEAYDQMWEKKTNQMLATNKEHIKMVNDYQAGSEKGLSKLMEGYSFKPEWEHVDATIVDEINNKLSSTGFFVESSYNRKLIIERIWDGIERYNINLQKEIRDNSDLSSSEKNKQLTANKKLIRLQKEEFFYMMYEKHLAWSMEQGSKATEQDVKDGLADEVGGPVKEFSVYALKDLARDILSPEKFEGGGIAGLLQKARDDGDKDMEIKLEIALSFAQSIVDADEDLLSGKDGLAERFGKAFISNDPWDYVPVWGSLVGIDEGQWVLEASTRIMNSDLLKKGDSRYDKSIPAATTEDRIMMTFYRMNTIMEHKLDEAYDVGGKWGKIIADMVPYMGEFFMTGGAYSTTQKLVSEGLRKKLYSQAVQNNRFIKIKPGDAIFGVNKLEIAEHMIGVTSYLIGTAAHASANPHQYVDFAIERMTPQMKFVLSDKFDDVITAQEISMLKMEMQSTQVDEINIMEYADDFVKPLVWEKGSWEGEPLEYDATQDGKDGYFYVESEGEDDSDDVLYQYNAKKGKYKKVKKNSEYYQTYLNELNKESKERKNKKLPADFDISVYEGMTINEILQYNTDNFEKEQGKNWNNEIKNNPEFYKSEKKSTIFSGNVEWDGNVPEGLAEALWTSWKLTWAEMATERLGEFLPGFIKHLTPWQLRGFGEYTRRMTIGRIAAHLGLENRGELLRHIIVNQMGYHGWMAEMGEETINQSLSSMILGEDMYSAFLDDEGNWDSKYFVEMGGAMFITSLVFTGGNVVRMRRKYNKRK